MRASRAQLAIALVVLAYLATRLALVWRAPPFWDEALFASFATTARDDSSHAFIALADNRGPLQTWLAVGLLELGASPLTAVRLVSVAAGAVVVAAVAAVARMLAGPAAALAAASVAVVAPILLVHDSMGIYDPPVNAAVAAALYLQLRLAREPRLWLGIPLGIAFAAGLLLKASAVAILVLLPLGLAVLAERSGPALRGRLGRWAGAVGIALGLAGAAYLVIRTNDLYPVMLRAREVFQHQHPLGEVVANPFRHLADNAALAAVLLAYLTPTLVAAAVAGVAFGVRGGPVRATLLVLGWVLVPLTATLLLATAHYPRYTLTAVPAFCVLAGVGLAGLAVRAARLGRRVRPAFAATLVLLALAAPALWRDAQVLADPGDAPYPGRDRWQYVTGWPSGNGIERVASRLRAEAGPGEVVVATDWVPPFGLGVTLGQPEIVRGTGQLPNRSPFRVRAGRTTFRFTTPAQPSIAARAAFWVHDLSAPRGPGIDAGRFRLLLLLPRPEGRSVLSLWKRTRG